MTPPFDTPKYNDLIYDVGLHRGEDSEYYLKKGFRVIAFEADNDLANETRSRLDVFIQSRRLVVEEGAIVDDQTLGSGVESIPFYKNLDNSVWGTVIADWSELREDVGARTAAVQVVVRDFRECMRTHGIPRYLKIDIEGVDIVCVEALQSFSERPDFLSIEADKDNIEPQLQALESLGYSEFQLIEQSAIPNRQSARNPALEGNAFDWAFVEGCSGLFGLELGPEWVKANRIRDKHREIRFGYSFLGEKGWMRKLRFPGAGRMRQVTRWILNWWLGESVTGWYDLHARLGKPEKQSIKP